MEEEEFTRAPILHKLCLGTPEPVARPQLQAVVEQWLSGAGFQENQWSLMGPSLGDKHAIFFKGDPGDREEGDGIGETGPSWERQAHEQPSK